MAKISILSGKIQCNATGKVLESFTATKGMEIVELIACVWDNSTHDAIAGQAEIALYEYVGEKKQDLVEPTKCRLIEKSGVPLKIQHHPTEKRTIKLIGTTPANEYIAYALRIATPS